jgi:hypothetical protein
VSKARPPRPSCPKGSRRPGAGLRMNKPSGQRGPDSWSALPTAMCPAGDMPREGQPPARASPARTPLRVACVLGEANVSGEGHCGWTWGRAAHVSCPVASF